MRDDPLLPLKKTPRSKIDPAHPRRGLTFDQVGLLIDAARRRPLMEKKIVRTGKDTGKLIAKVHPRVRAKMERLGQQRMLCYLIAAWTGLRREEMKQLQWRDVDLDRAVPLIQLRANTTKSKRPDPLTLHPQLVNALRAAKPPSFNSEDRILKTIPDMKTFRADLKAANINPGNRQIGFVDLHALRMACNSNLAANGVSAPIRQSHMRHTDPRLTANTYLDEKLLPIAQAIQAVPWIPVAAMASAGGQKLVTDDGPMTTLMTTMTTDLEQKAVVARLDVTPSDYKGQEDIVELVVRGPRSQVEQIQRIGQALSLNDKTRHREAPGL